MPPWDGLAGPWGLGVWGPAIRTWPQAPQGCFLSGGPGAWVALSALLRDGPFLTTGLGQAVCDGRWGAGGPRGGWERDLGL